MPKRRLDIASGRMEKQVRSKRRARAVRYILKIWGEEMRADRNKTRAIYVSIQADKQTNKNIIQHV